MMNSLAFNCCAISSLSSTSTPRRMLHPHLNKTLLYSMFMTMALSGCGLALIPKANQRNKAMFQRSSPLFVSRALCSRCSRPLCKSWHRLFQTFSAYFLRWPLRFLLEPHSVFPCFWLACWQARGKFPHRMTSVLQCLARPPMSAFYRQWAVSDRKLLIASQLLQLVSCNPIQTHRTQSHYTHTPVIPLLTLY